MSNSKSIHNQHENYELKPCPFCGCFVYPIQDTMLLCGHRYWYIRHKNSECILSGNFRSKLYTTKEKLICAWNNTLKEAKGESSVNIDHSSLCKTETYNVETSG